MKKRTRLDGKPAVDLFEEAIGKLRRCDIATWLCYYIGAIPFMLALLYFWSEMSAGAYAEKSLGNASMGMAGAYIWIKCWQSVFVNRLLALTGTQAPIHWTAGRILRLIAQQTIVQSTAVFILPVAAIITVPFGWAYCFYQNFLIAGSGEALPVRVLVKRSLDQSKLWPAQNHCGIGLLFIGGCAVFINVLSLLWLAPGLIKTLLGIETMFSRNPFSLFNSTVLMIAWAGTCLVLGPLAKAFFVLRCFYGRAVGTGEDLKVAIRKIRALAICILGGVILCAGATARAADPQQLNQSIDQVLARPEYAWRMPCEATIDTESTRPTLLGRFAKTLRDGLKACWIPLRKWSRRIGDWIEKHFIHSREQPEIVQGMNWKGTFQQIVYLLCIGVVIGAGWIAWRAWKQSGMIPQIVAEPVRATPDLRSEQVTADELPEDRWIELAQRLASEGEFRLSLRALYLAGLAHLGTKSLVTITRAKSNKEFRLELSRRARLQPELIDAFGESVRDFERVWYGTGEATPESLKRYTSNLERIQAC